MNIEIPDELAVELADAHAATFGGTMNYGRLVELVGALLVYIPDPRAPRPQGVETTFTWIDEVPVETLVLDPAPKRGKLTRHQREVYDSIVRMSRRLSGGVRRLVWVDAGNIGSKNACDRLVEKGWIEMEIEYGPRGGEHRSYRPIIEETS